MDLIRPLGLAGIDCAVVASRGWAPARSRFTRARIPWLDPAAQAGALVQALLDFAASQDEPPVLYYQNDAAMLAISRGRDALGEAFRFLMPDAELVDALADKEGFAALAAQLELPVPLTRVIGADDPAAAAAVDLPYPVIVKPARHDPGWRTVSSSKAVQAGDFTALRRIAHELGPAAPRLVVQAHIPGPETRIDSYHVFVDAAGSIAGEFTGRKIRTHPAQYGYSTAVEITDDAEVRELGRECVWRLALRGVAKLDFKRDPEGRMWLLEVNPRFSLWHLPGALAGVNLPALVFADLTGRPRPPREPVRAGTTWCELRQDFQARKAEHIPALRWAAWALRADAKRSVALDDPMPFLAGIVGRRVLERAAGVRLSARSDGRLSGPDRRGR
jgi:predicted ATP-grasp superfamily ATP-dependent carboligase